MWAGFLFGGSHSDVAESVKPFATIDEQIDVLVARGLTLDRAVAEQWLRTLIHGAIARVEVALRSHVSYRVGSIGPLAYRDASAGTLVRAADRAAQHVRSPLSRMESLLHPGQHRSAAHTRRPALPAGGAERAALRGTDRRGIPTARHLTGHDLDIESSLAHRGFLHTDSCAGGC